jgi:hypothetical protein
MAFARLGRRRSAKARRPSRPSASASPTQVAAACSTDARIGIRPQPFRRTQPQRAAFDRAADALAACGSQSPPPPDGDAARLRAASSTAMASGCVLPCSSAAARRSSCFLNAWRRVAAPPAPCGLRSGAGLVQRQHESFSARSSASAERTRMPSCAPRPSPTMTAVGVASPSAQGQAMTSTATAGIRLCGEVAAGQPPADKGQRGDDDHGRHENAGDAVGQFLDRRFRALRGFGQAHDFHQLGLRADTFGAHPQQAVEILAAGMHAVAALRFATGRLSPVSRLSSRLERRRRPRHRPGRARRRGCARHRRCAIARFRFPPLAWPFPPRRCVVADRSIVRWRSRCVIWRALPAVFRGAPG